MSDIGVLSEFDPLAASKSAPGQPESQDKENQTSATGELSTKSSVLDEFDPLTQQGGADQGQASHSVKQDSTAPVHSEQSTSTMAVSTLQSSSNISPHKPTCTQSHAGDYQNGSSIKLGSAHEVEQFGPSKGGGVATGAASRSAVSETSKSDRIGAEISQIDSVLKALNMGQFDVATMASFTAKSQPYVKPQSRQLKQVPQYNGCRICH